MAADLSVAGADALAEAVVEQLRCPRVRNKVEMVAVGIPRAVVSAGA